MSNGDNTAGIGDWLKTAYSQDGNIEFHICDPDACELCEALKAYHPGIPNTWNPPVLTPPAKACDCGARVAKTTHAHWCATCKP